MANSRLEFLKDHYYHISNLGGSGFPLFEKQEDIEKMYEIFKKYSKLYQKSIKILSYCILGNQFQVVVHCLETGRDISDYMRKIQVSFAMYFKKKYNEYLISGQTVFQGRFFSHGIETNQELQDILSFVNMTPHRLGVVQNIQEYQYCSYRQVNFQSMIDKKQDVIPSKIPYIHSF